MVLGRPVVLDWAQSDQPSEDTIDPATVCGEVSVEQGLPGRTAATMPAAIALQSGTRFDLETIRKHFCTVTGDHAASLR
jgi:hypothetical protein